MMTEGRVRAIAAQVAAAIAAKIKPSVSEEQIRSDVEAVIRQMQENGELTGSDLTDEQIAAVQENAEAAAGSATIASKAAAAAQTAQSKAEDAQTAAEGARDEVRQLAATTENAAQTAAGKATEASESATAAGAAKTAAEEAAARAEEAANRLLGVAVVGVIDENGHLVLTGLLEDGTYTAYYEVQNDDGTKSLVEIGELTLVEEETPEPDPDPVTYTVTFVADGVTVAEVEYAVGDTIEEPAVPAKDGYTGVWETYDLSNGGNIIVNAVYTAIEPAEPKNYVVYDENNTTTGDTSLWTNQARVNSSGSVVADTSTTYGVAVVSNFIPVQNGDTVYYEGFYTSGKSSWLGDKDENPVKYGALSTIQTSGHIKDLSESTAGDRSGQFTINNDTVRRLRLGGFVRDTDTPVIKIMRGGEWLTGEEETA